MPVRKMIVFVPIMDQMKMIASAASALYSRRASRCARSPDRCRSSSWFRMPVLGEELQRDHADHDPRDRRRQEVDRTEEPPAADVLMQQRHDDERDSDSEGHRSSSSTLFSSTRWTIGSLNAAVWRSARSRSVPSNRPARQRVAERLHDRRPQQGSDEHDRRTDSSMPGAPPAARQPTAAGPPDRRVGGEHSWAALQEDESGGTRGDAGAPAPGIPDRRDKGTGPAGRCCPAGSPAHAAARLHGLQCLAD